MNNLKLVEEGKTYIAVSEVRACRTCAHKDDKKCMLSGYYIETERKYASRCGVNFQGWEQRPPRKGLFTRVKEYFYGEGDHALNRDV